MRLVAGFPTSGLDLRQLTNQSDKSYNSDLFY